MVECLHSAHSKFPAESVSERIFACDSYYAKRAYAIAITSVRPSVCPSVRHTGGSVKNG